VSRYATVTGSCEYGNEPSASIKGEEVFLKSKRLLAEKKKIASSLLLEIRIIS
jgi:hypothetical protein